MTLVLVSVACGGCNALGGYITAQERPPAVLLDRDGVDVVTAAPERQVYFFKDQKSAERFCRAPGTDFAEAAQTVASLSGIKGIGAAAGDSSAVGIQGLGGRSPEVLIARELLYRACELTTNLGADAELSQRIYSRFLDAIEHIATSQTSTSTGSPAGALLPTNPDPIGSPPATPK